MEPSVGDEAVGACRSRVVVLIRQAPSDIRSVAVRKPDLLNAAHELQDLRVSPGAIGWRR